MRNGRTIVAVLLCAAMVAMPGAAAVAQDVRPASVGGIHRIFGTSRYATNSSAIQYFYQSSTLPTTAVLVSGMTFTGAAPAASLAGVFRSPVLGTQASTLGVDTANSLRYLGVSKVYVVMESKHVPPGLDEALRRILGPGGEVVRIVDEDVVRMAAAAATTTAELAPDAPREAFLVPYDPEVPGDFQAAVSVAPYAYKRGVPVIFTDPATLSAPAADALTLAGVTKVTIVGSRLKVAERVVSDLAAMGIACERLDERGRDGIGSAAADRAIDKGWADPVLTVVSNTAVMGESLWGGWIAGRQGGVQVFTEPAALSFSTQDFLNRRAVGTALLLGPEAAFPSTLIGPIVAAAPVTGGSIAGTVTAEATDAPLEGIRVRAWGWDQTSTVSPGFAAGGTTTGADGTFTLSRLEPGRYWLTFEDPSGEYCDESYDGAPPEPTHGDLVAVANGTTATASVTMLDAAEWDGQRVGRLSGPDRYTTALAISRENFRRSDLAVLVTGQNFPDALPASALAGAYKAPLLLTRTASVPDGLVAELRRLGTKQLLIVGGYPAVSKAVEDSLKAQGFAVRARIAGIDRYDTAAQVYDHMRRDCPGMAVEPFVVRGDQFPDALAAAPFAYRQVRPIVLVRPTSAPDSVRALFGTYRIGSVIVIGSERAVAAGVIDQLRAASGVSMWSSRLQGADRYETAVAVAGAWRRSFDYVGIATGADFPDALSGGVATGARGGALLLTRKDAMPPSARAFITDNAPSLWQVRMFGSTYAVGDGISAEIGTALHSAE